MQYLDHVISHATLDHGLIVFTSDPNVTSGDVRITIANTGTGSSSAVTVTRDILGRIALTINALLQKNPEVPAPRDIAPAPMRVADVQASAPARAPDVGVAAEPIKRRRGRPPKVRPVPAAQDSAMPVDSGSQGQVTDEQAFEPQTDGPHIPF